MKRLLLPASALVLVLTACGAGAKPAPQAARRLLREFVRTSPESLSHPNG